MSKISIKEKKEKTKSQKEFCAYPHIKSKRGLIEINQAN